MYILKMLPILANFLYVSLSVLLIHLLVPTTLSTGVKVVVDVAIFFGVYFALRAIAPQMFVA